MSQMLPPYALGNDEPTPPVTKLIWAYEVKAQRDELLAELKEAEHFLLFHEDSESPHMLRIRHAIKKVEATL